MDPHSFFLRQVLLPYLHPVWSDCITRRVQGINAPQVARSSPRLRGEGLGMRGSSFSQREKSQG